MAAMGLSRRNLSPLIKTTTRPVLTLGVLLTSEGQRFESEGFGLSPLPCA
jgi:hypothetical protein